MSSRPNRFVDRLIITAAGAALLLSGCATTTPRSGIDHHMHIRSQAVMDLIAELCRTKPELCSPEMKSETAPLSGVDAVAVLDAAELERGVLLSTAYLFGFSVLQSPGLDVAEAIRAENEYVVGQASRHKRRLVPFISVDPTDASALPELEHWHRAGGARGLKLHLGNSEVNLRDPAQVRQLAEVFKAAGRMRMPIAVHLRGSTPDYGAEDVRIFLRDVVPHAGGVPIQIAHAASWGSFDAKAEAALGAFAAAFEAKDPATRNIWIDLSSVAMTRTKPEHYPIVAALVRRIGVERMLMGSDWFATKDPAAHYRETEASIPLTAAEWRTIRGNRAPYLR